VSGARDPLGTRMRWRGERALVRVLGRRIECAECGRPLFRAIPIVWRGELKLIGLAAEEPLVAVAWRRSDTLEFRHVELDSCPSPERPWVR
jgi:hypothetical protein